MDDRERHERGMAVRRAVLGEAHVNRAQQRSNDFNREFQDFITRYAWGEIWMRPGLERPTRSLITLAMMIALNRGDEFQMHVRAALSNGPHQAAELDCIGRSVTGNYRRLEPEMDAPDLVARPPGAEPLAKPRRPREADRAARNRVGELQPIYISATLRPKSARNARCSIR